LATAVVQFFISGSLSSKGHAYQSIFKYKQKHASNISVLWAEFLSCIRNAKINSVNFKSLERYPVYQQEAGKADSLLGFPFHMDDPVISLLQEEIPFFQPPVWILGLSRDYS
jgi:hypothetical protein